MMHKMDKYIMLCAVLLCSIAPAHASTVSQSDCQGLSKIKKYDLLKITKEQENIVRECMKAGVDLPLEWRPAKGTGAGIFKEGMSSVITVKSGPESPPGAPNIRADLPGFGGVSSLINSLIDKVVTQDEIDEQLADEGKTPTPDSCGLFGARSNPGKASGSVAFQCGGTVAIQEEIMTVVPNPTHAAFIDKHQHVMNIYRKSGNQFVLEQKVDLPKSYCEEALVCTKNDGSGGGGAHNYSPAPYKLASATQAGSLIDAETPIEFLFAQDGGGGSEGGGIGGDSGETCVIQCDEKFIFPISQYFTFNNSINIMSVELDPEISEEINAAVDFVHVERKGAIWEAPPTRGARDIVLKSKDPNFGGYHIRPNLVNSCFVTRFHPRTAACDGSVVDVNLDDINILVEPNDDIAFFEVQGRNELFVEHTPRHSLHMRYYNSVDIALGQSLNVAEGGSIQVGSQFIELNVPNQITSNKSGTVRLSNGGIVTNDTGKKVGELAKGGQYSTSGPIRFFPQGGLPFGSRMLFRTTPDAMVRFPDETLRNNREARTKVQGGL